MRLWNRIERVLEQSLETSREVLDKARTGAKELGESAKELGEVGVLKFDVLQLERRSAKVLSKLGHEVYEAFGDQDRTTLSRDVDGVKELLAELRDIERRIDEKERWRSCARRTRRRAVAATTSRSVARSSIRSARRPRRADWDASKPPVERP